MHSELGKLSAEIPFQVSFALPTGSNFSDNTVEPISIVNRYTQADLLRILRVTPRQLAAWEKAGLVAAADTYSFFELLQVKKVRDLCARKVRPAVIRQSLEAMLKHAGFRRIERIAPPPDAYEQHRRGKRVVCAAYK